VICHETNWKLAEDMKTDDMQAESCYVLHLLLLCESEKRCSRLAWPGKGRTAIKKTKIAANAEIANDHAVPLILVKDARNVNEETFHIDCDLVAHRNY
jgi:hypothetical protein